MKIEIMDAMKQVLAYSNLALVREQLIQWGEKKPSKRIDKMVEMLTESEVFFRHQDNELRTARQRTGDLEIKAIEMSAEMKIIKGVKEFENE